MCHLLRGYLLYILVYRLEDVKVRILLCYLFLLVPYSRIRAEALLEF
jgi:hypothetical protein